MFDPKARQWINLAYTLPMTIAGGLILGLVLDQKTGKNYFTPLFLFLGIMSGAVKTYKDLRRLTASPPKK